MRVLVLGGTAEASGLAHALTARPEIEATLSLAGRTRTPAALPLPTRVGGFGGVDGLALFLRKESIEAVVDATHPFAARISANAAAACRACGVPLAVLSRPAWQARVGDRWTSVKDVDAAARHLAGLPGQLVFLTTGRLDLAAFRAAPQHRYLVRTIDLPASEALPPDTEVILARGPYAVADEIATMQAHGTTLLVSKNSGGAASAAKLEAARRLGLPVLMIARPASPERLVLEGVDAVLAWIDAHRPRSYVRGVRTQG